MEIKKWIILILRILVLLASLMFVFYKVDFNYLFNSILRKLPFWVLALSVLLSIIRVWMNGIRWRIANTDDSNQLSNWDYFRYMMISSSFNLVMPGVLGGDIIKAVWVGSDLKTNRTRNVLSIFFDRSIGMLSIFLLGLLAFSFTPFFHLNTKLIVWCIAIILFFLLILLIWYIKKDSFGYLINNWQPKKSVLLKIKKTVITTRDIITIYLKRPQIIIYTLLLSIVMHVTFFAMNFLIAAFLGIRISFLDISIISCLVWLITAVPISIAGIGIREISYISLLGYYGVTAEAATGLSLYSFSVAIIIGLLGLPFVWISKRKKNDQE